MKRNTVALYKGRPFREGTPEAQEAYWPPIPLISLAAPLREAGYNVLILDHKLTQEEIWGILEENLDDLVCFCVSALTGYEISDALVMAERLKKRRPTTPVVWGGWHSSVLPHETLEDPRVDIVSFGLGQNVIVPIVERLRDGIHRFDDLPKTIATPEYSDAPIPENIGPIAEMDLSAAALPAYDMLDLEHIRQERLSSVRKKHARGLTITGAMPVVTSFGCPFRCTYCCNPNVFGGSWGAYDVDRVVEQITWLHGKGFNWIEFIDAEFLVRWKRVKKIMEGIVNAGIEIRWGSQATITAILNLEKHGMFPLLVEAGCFSLQIGVESGSENVMKYIDKNQCFDDVLEVARILKKHGVEGTYNCLAGLPKHETFSDIYATFRLAFELKKISAESMFPISFYSPLPGSVMFNDSLDAGFKAPQSLEEWGRYDTAYRNQAAAIPWRSKKLEELAQMVITFYLALAVPGDIERGTITYLKTHLKRHRLRWIIKWAHKLAALRMKNQFFDFAIEYYLFNWWQFIMGRKGYEGGQKVLEV